ncbi:hypothetical protein CASFOL_000056 [Castilleja foliolosa]|uniref:Uncharacterized protein n=1 Tax=Castilleja foliolosa TaxID=1961234 RepID=A0ABD3ERI5_9LAMI
MGSVSNSSLPGEVSNRRPLENGYVPKYKARRVSAIRDFPPGCGRNAHPINVKPGENVVSEAAGIESLETNNELFGNTEMAVKIEINDVINTADMPELVKESGIQNAVGPSGVKSSDIEMECQLDVVNNTVDVDLLESLDALLGNITVNAKLGVDTVNEMKSDNETGNDHLALVKASDTEEASVWPKDKYRTRSMSAVRYFPPHCGRSVTLPTEEEKTMVTAGNEKVEEAPEKTENGKNEITIYSADRNDGGISSVKEEEATFKNSDGGVGENEGTPEITPISMLRPVPDTSNSDSDSDSDSAEPVGKDMVVYSAETGDKTKPTHCVFTSADEVDRKIVHVLMAEPNCTWRKEKKTASLKTSPVAKTSVEKKEKPIISWRLKGRAVAKKSTHVVKPSIVLSKKKTTHQVKPSRLLSKKKKLEKVITSDDADSNPSALVLANDEEGHNRFSPKKSAVGHKKQKFEDYLPPFGPNSSSQGDARSKVRNTLKEFNTICRKLLQLEESNSKPEEEGISKKKKANRIDLSAAKAIKEKGQEVNTGKPILGDVPGVEVGDEFQYRTELAIVGIHRLYQAGIDSMKLSNNLLVATSIVSSGAYTDDLENADVLVYSGQGGNVVGKQKEKPQDQKLEKGNLALKNSIDAETPVRVIRGWKEKAVDPLDPKPKMFTTYVYDGLYTVKKYWTEKGPHGKQVFMFELRRNPGQPELAWKELKKTKKSNSRPGICVTDISCGKEAFAICAVNTIDDEKLPPFNYISKMMYSNWYNPDPPAGCNCSGRCSDSRKCKCAVRNDGKIPYNRNGALVEIKHLIYECGPHCKCPPSCYNRVSQRGIRLQLDVFKTESRGWGVRSLTSIPSGSFICEYTGELLEDTEAERKIGKDEYLFDIGQNLSKSSLNPEDQALSAELVEDGGFTIDACRHGNIGRFINHSCSPNLYAQNVIYDHDDLKTPHIMMFAMENIPPLQELTYDYNYPVDQITDSSGNIKVKKCYCGTAQCTGRMY